MTEGMKHSVSHLSDGVVHRVDGPADHPGEEIAGVAELVRQTVDLKRE